MDNLMQILTLLFRRMPVKRVIDGQIQYDNLSEEEFRRLFFGYNDRYSETEITNMWMFYKDVFDAEHRREGRTFMLPRGGFPVFESLFYYVNRMLVIQNNTVVCRYNQFLQWRDITYDMGEDVLVAAFCAANKKPEEMQEMGFAWQTVIGHNNYQLNQIMKRGISENHFHLYGSAPIFHISWLSLMNHISSAKAMEHLKEYNVERRSVNVKYDGNYEEDTLVTQYHQAAYIRVLLFSDLIGKQIEIGPYRVCLKDFIDYIQIQDLILPGRKTINKIDVLKLKNILHGSESNENIWTILLQTILQQEDLSNGCMAEVTKENAGLHILFLKLFGDIDFSKDYFDEIESPYITIPELIVFLGRNMELKKLRYMIPHNVYEEIWKSMTINNINRIIQNPYLMDENLSVLQSIIDTFRSIQHPKAPLLEDYALSIFGEHFYTVDKCNGIFSGERWLLYACLHRIWRGKEEPLLANMFWAYVLIRETLRAELIQSNSKVGFLNFQKYNRRKKTFIYDPNLKNEMVRLAVRDNLIHPYIKSFEIRISPQNTAQGNFKLINNLDEIISLPTHRHYYVMHFTKSPDNANPVDGFQLCRNHTVRSRIKKQAKAIVLMRERYPQCAKRVLGIDAASNEIGCRPEVFGSVFRYLRNHMKIVMGDNGREKIPQMGITYHVGEDFLDVTDGLRAIDEAVEFLHMECGDRLGHALALGIDVEEWYRLKNGRILIAQQDYLDNLVWIYNRMIQFNIKEMDFLKDYIEQNYSRYFDIIYGRHMDHDIIQKIIEEATETYRKNGIPFASVNNCYNFDIFKYYSAWKIRGDDPSLYEHGYFMETKEEFSIADYYANKNFPKHFDIRYSPEVFLLNYFYHFNSDVRREGAKKIEVVIKPIYIQCVKLIQAQMRIDIARRGIGIETNPSSNYLIGTFKKYENHPIFTFYNKELINSKSFSEKEPQMSVSVNTDDMGVFSTSLENEYALLACALENIKDKEGKCVYSKAEIYSWIDSVRRMGNDQSFLLQKQKTKQLGGEL